MAMDYTTDGKPAVRVLSNIQGDIIISGDVNIPGEVTVSSTPENPIHNHITEVGTSGILDVPYLPIGGTVTVNQPVAVTDNNGSLTVDGTVTALQGTTPWQISKDANANSDSNRIFVNASGTVELGATTLSALENITVSGTVELGATTLSALETVNATVSGTVALDTATLSALENISATVSGTVELGATTLSALETVTVNQGTNPWTVTGTVNTIPAVITGATDAFGRMRVSEPYTLGDYSHVYGEELELLTKTSGASSTATSIANIAAIRLTVGTGNGDYVIHQSRMYHQYMPGKSQLINASFCFGASNLNVAKRVGYFGNRNGVFFQQVGDGTVNGQMSIVMRSFVTGSIVDTPIYQNDPLNTGRDTWNIDPLDGTGPSGYDIDLTRSQLLFIDFQWLGVGRVRVGFVHDGLYILAHEFYHTNDIATVYWSLPSQPIRCEIRNLAATASTATMDQMCATVISEGGYKESGVDKAANCDAAIHLGKTSPTNKKGVMALRLKNTYNGLPNRSIVRIQNIDLYSDSASCRWEMWRLEDPSAITNGTWVDAGTDSVVEYNTTMGTGYDLGAIYGEKVNTGWIAANNPSGKQASGSTQAQDPSQAKRGYISQNIDSTGSNIYLIIMENLSTTAETNVYSAVQWRETR